MTKMINSLVTKLTLSFILLIVVIAGLAFFITYQETKKALKEQMISELQSVASAVAVTIDGGAHARIKAGGEGSPEFIKIAAQLMKVKKANDQITYIYTMKNTGKEARFVVDPDPEEPAAIDEIYPGAPRELLDGFNHVSADHDFVTDKWGTYLSGYAPIRDSLGNSTGLVGIDMSSQEVLARQKFIGKTIYVVMAIAVLLAGIIILLFSGTIFKDVNRLNLIANKISHGDMDVKLDIKRNDEIGELAESFSRMVASLKIMMSHESDHHQGDK
jgi:methyl-accepting chemotaxis protein